MEILGLFPVGVGRVNIGAPTDDEAAALAELGSDQVANEGNTTSKARLILNDPRLGALRAKIQAELDRYVDAAICPANRPQIFITQSWQNHSKKGQWHHRHAHPNSWISAVYYLAADAESDKIYFHRNQGYDRLIFAPVTLNPFNSDLWWLPVTAGDLVIFPSSLIHHVAPVETDTTRISLSLNTWFEGTAGAEESLTQLTCRVAPPFV